MDRYLKGLLDPFVSLLEIHKLHVFPQSGRRGTLPRLTFKRKYLYGPYSPDIPPRSDSNGKTILRAASAKAATRSNDADLNFCPVRWKAPKAFLAKNDAGNERAHGEGGLGLIEGYEDPYGMELLSSVHWVMAHDSRSSDRRRSGNRGGSPLEPAQAKAAETGTSSKSLGPPERIRIGMSSQTRSKKSSGDSPQADGSEGFSALIRNHPALAAQWHPTKNAPLTPDKIKENSYKLIWWTCSKGHEFPSRVNKRTRQGYGCSFCAGQRTAVEDSIAVLLPKLAAEWHPSKNTLLPTDVRPGSNRKVWWLCAKGHRDWEATVGGRGAWQRLPEMFWKRIAL